MLDLLDEQQSLTINQWKIFTACLFSTMLDFFDFFLISFALAFFVSDWHLTFGQSGMILFASGVSAIPGGWFFGWLGDRIGRRKVFMITVLTFSGATGLMALTPHGAWPFMVAMRFIVGFGNAGMVAVDLPLLQEFMPASKRGWVSGLATALLPAGPALAAALSASLGAIIGWRGLFAIGLLPAAMAFMIRVWVPESPRWLIGQGRVKEARRSLAWALQIDPEQISVPVEVAEVQRTSWAELFKYPRSIAVGCLTGLSQTGVAGLGLWGVVLLALILKVSPAEASFLAIWIGLTAVPGRAVGAWLSDLLGRRYAGILTGLLGAAAMLAAGYWHDVYVGAFSVYYLMLLAHGFIGGPGANFAIVFPYMAELWPANLRASGFGFVYGTSNIGKFIGPAGLAVIAGASNYVAPKATLDAIVPAFIYFSSWYFLAALAFLLIGVETRGRTIEQLDAAIVRPASTVAASDN